MSRFAREDDRTLAERRRRETLREASAPTLRLNMTPMIDVVFLLLIYFVLVADFAEPESVAGLDVVQRAAATDDPFALPEVPTVLALVSEGDAPDGFAVRTDRVVFAGASSFAERTRAAFDALGPRHAIIIDPAPDARWEHAVVAYRALRDAGFERVELSPED